MSAVLFGQVWGLALSRNQQTVLLALADHADKFARCFPSVRLLAWKTDYAERTVQRVLKELRQLRILKPVAHAAGGYGRATEYELHLENARKKAITPRPERGESCAEGQLELLVDNPVDKSPATTSRAARNVQKRVTLEVQKGDIAVSPQPSVTVMEPPVGAARTLSKNSEPDRSEGFNPKSKIQNLKSERQQTLDRWSAWSISTGRRAREPEKRTAEVVKRCLARLQAKEDREGKALDHDFLWPYLTGTFKKIRTEVIGEECQGYKVQGTGQLGAILQSIAAKMSCSQKSEIENPAAEAGVSASGGKRLSELFEEELVRRRA